MRCLLYCIFTTSQRDRIGARAGCRAGSAAARCGDSMVACASSFSPASTTTNPDIAHMGITGVRGQPVNLIGNNGLTAAVSAAEPADLAPDVARVLAYGAVIDRLHREMTVIPMRYGCFFEEEDQVLRLLDERHREYRALLRELEGCVEMGVRILFPGQVGERENRDPGDGCAAPLPLNIPDGASEAAGRGRAYLAAQRHRYAALERAVAEEELSVERICTHLSGCFLRTMKDACTVAGRRLLSLSFLVRREKVAPFRATFRQIASGEGAELLLSGPWPPYTFAQAAPGPCQQLPQPRG